MGKRWLKRLGHCFFSSLGAYLLIGAGLMEHQAALEQNSDYTKLFRTELRVLPNGSVEVTETIVHDFGIMYREGIERTLSLRRIEDDYETLRSISDIHVTAGERTPVEAQVYRYRSSERLEISVGSPGTTVTGTHTYQMRYTVDVGLALNQVGENWELDFDTLDGWDYPVERAEIYVYGASISDASCHYVVCEITETSKIRTVAVATNLEEDSSFNLKAVMVEGSLAQVAQPTLYTEDTFVLPTVTRGPAIKELRENSNVSWKPSLGIVAAIVMLVLLTGSSLWTAHRRWAGKISTDTLFETFSTSLEAVNQASPRSAGGSTIIDTSSDPTVEFEPPDKLPPAHLGFLHGQYDEETLLMGTVLDLAARGFIEPLQINRVWEFKSKGVSNNLSEHERLAVQATVHLDDHRIGGSDRYIDYVTEHSKLVRDDLVAKGYLKSPKYIQRFMLIPIVTCVLILLHLLPGPLFVSPDGKMVLILIYFGSFIFLGSIPGAFDARIRLTARGKALRFRVRGFAKFMKESESSHVSRAMDAGALREYVGYAAVLKTTRS